MKQKGTMYTVTVLMSTYNGEAYLQQQIESILSQQDVSVCLHIRDDASSDGTRGILGQFGDDDRVSVYLGHNVGPSLSFMKLIYDDKSHADYYAFADQDDLWLPNKLSKAIGLLNSMPEKTLYASNQIIANSDGEAIGMRYDSLPPTDLLNIIDKNYLSGCTMVMSNSLFNLVKETHPSEKVLSSRMHDTWVASLAALTEGIVYDEDSCIYYRQHNTNVVGIKKVNPAKKLMTKLIHRGHNFHKIYADELCNCISSVDSVSDDSKQILRLYSSTDTIRGKIDLLKSDCFRSHYSRNRLIFALKLFLFE